MISLLHSAPELAALVDPSTELVVIASGFRFTEGPVWTPRDSSLLFSDIHADTRWRWTREEGATVVAHPNRIGNGMTIEPGGALLVCEHVTSSVVREYADGRSQVVSFHYNGTYLNSPNDVVARSDGSVYFSDPDYGRWDHVVGVHRPFELGFQGVFLVPSGGGATRLVVGEQEFDQPNGLCFSPDETVLYVNDLHGLHAFDVAPNGWLSNGRTLHEGMGDNEVPGRGNPDGMRCDELGNIWCTARGGLWIISPAGDLLGIIETPETSANLTWGGDDWHTLFICTSSSVRALRTLVGPAPRVRAMAEER